MANNLKVAEAGVNAEAAALGALLNNGYLRIYSGTQPTNPEDAKAGTLLAELRFGATAFGSPSAGVITANAITQDSDADATGTATWFRCLKSGGVDITDNVFDGSVGTSGCDLNLNTTAIVQHAQVSVTSLTYTRPKS